MKPTSELNFGSLSKPVTKADIAAYKQSQTMTARDKAFRLWKRVLGPVSFIIILGLVYSLSLGQNLFTTTGLVLVTGLFGFGIAVLVIRFNDTRLARLYRFVQDNGIQFTHDRYNPNYSGMIFDEGRNRIIQESFVFQDGTELGNYEFTTGSGRSKHTSVYGFVKIPLTRALPNMVLDAHQNNMWGIFTGLTDSFDRSQKLSLEGDFDKYFTLYAPKKYERDALYVFTPDVMERLIEDGKNYDMEIVDDQLYMYSSTRFNLTSEILLRSLIAIVETISKEIRSQTKRYRDERISDNTANVIAQQGKRLKGGTSFIFVAILIVVAIQVGQAVLGIVSPGVASVISTLFGFVILALIVGSIVYYARKRSK